MKRMHIHLAVADLDANVSFYSALFQAEPTVLKDDYAKWMLEDPRVNFAISTRSGKLGLDHLGIQADNDAELMELKGRLDHAAAPVIEQQGAGCCYAVSDKYWTMDPQGTPWESFHSLAAIPVFGDQPDLPVLAQEPSSCCAPPAGAASSSCCG